LVLILDERTRAKNANLPAYLQREIPNITKVQLVNSQKHNLVQLADLLTGCIYGDLTNNTHRSSSRSSNIFRQVLGSSACIRDQAA